MKSSQIGEKAWLQKMAKRGLNFNFRDKLIFKDPLQNNILQASLLLCFQYGGVFDVTFLRYLMINLLLIFYTVSALNNRIIKKFKIKFIETVINL